MASTTVIASPTNFLALDVVKKIQDDFAANCSLWLDNIYPVAYIGEQIKGEATHTFPRVYINDGTSEYIDVMPNESVKGISFFEIEGTYELDRENEEFEISLNMIFWVNMRLIDDKGYDYRHELIADAIRCLDTGTLTNDISAITVEENFENIYTRYNLPQTTLQQFMYPFTAFKLNFTVNTCDINLSCIPVFSLTSSPSNC